MPTYKIFIPHYPFTLENLEGENWLPIKDFPHYAISNFGRVKSLRADKPDILRPSVCTDGYLKITLYNADNKLVTTRVHILVARAFIPNPDNLPVIDHIDNNRFNNYVGNLEWVTVAENNRRSREYRRQYGIVNTSAPEQPKTPAIITVENVRGYPDKDGTAWLNVEDVARGLGFTENAASGNITIRWRTVRTYLESFGYKPIAGSCDAISATDFIPENIFYRLAMKAKNEAAEKFQAKIADEILPTLRKTGKYELYPQPKNPPPVHNDATPFERAKLLVEMLKYTDDPNLRDDLIRQAAILIKN